MSFDTKNHQIPTQNNSWYIKVGHMHYFFCKCGQTNSFGNILSTIYHPDNYCHSCGNTHYLDSMMFLFNKKVVRWSIFNWDIEKIKTKKEWLVRTYASIPVFDYTLQKIRFIKIIFFTRSMSFQGERDQEKVYPLVLKKYVYNHLSKATEIQELMYEDAKQGLYEFILETPQDKINWIENTKLDKLPVNKRTQLLSFFLEYGHLKEYDFFYWDNFDVFKEISKKHPSIKEMLLYISNQRKEKSIKKAHLQSYMDSMKIHSRYNYVADYIFSHHIEDRNFLLALIRMDTKVKHVLFEETVTSTIEYFLVFLKNYYSEKEITKLFTALHADEFKYHQHIVRDTIRMFRSVPDDFRQEHFGKVPASFQNIHDEFIRMNALRDISLSGKVEFNYHENDLMAQGEKDQLDYRLPETTHILLRWSQQLHNCMHGYSKSIHQGKTVIYGVFKDDILTYAVEIRGNKIVQALGKYNQRLEEEDKAEIDAWFKKVYVATWMAITKKI